MEDEKCPRLNEFCYVCGVIVPKKGEKERKNYFSEIFIKAYKSYFLEPDSSGLDYTPDTVCKRCYNVLLSWYKNTEKRSFSFVKPMMWIRDPNGHDPARCYACVNFTPRLSHSRAQSKIYEGTFTAIRPVPRPPGVAPPAPPSPDRQTESTDYTNLPDLNDYDYEPSNADDGPWPLTQKEMDYLVAKLNLSQRNAQMLTAFLKRRKLTEQTVNSTSYRKRQAEFQTFYSVDDDNCFTYCHDIPALTNKLGMEYNAHDWRLFIDGSTTSLKAVLLHITNQKPSIPIGFGIYKKETYATLKDIMEKIKYEEHKWKICCDLKVINILQGIIEKGGFPKYFCFICFLCNWDSRYKVINQYDCIHWEPRTDENRAGLREHNEPLIKDVTEILLPPLHTKLGICGKLIEVVVKDVDGAFDCLKDIFPRLSDDKITKGKNYSLLKYFHICIWSFRSIRITNKFFANVFFCFKQVSYRDRIYEN